MTIPSMNHQGVLAPKDSKPDHQRYPLCRPHTSAPKMPNHPVFFLFFPLGHPLKAGCHSWDDYFHWPAAIKYTETIWPYSAQKRRQRISPAFFSRAFFRLNFQPDSGTSQILNLKFWEMFHWNLPTSEPQDLLGVWRYGLIVCVSAVKIHRTKARAQLSSFQFLCSRSFQYCRYQQFATSCIFLL